MKTISKILLIGILALSFNIGFCQIPRGYFPPKFDGRDTFERFVSYNSDSFCVSYAYNPFSFFDAAVLRLKQDSCGKTREFTAEEYAEYNHYDALVSVYRVINNYKELISAPIEGCYVPKGCYEDQPENYIREALKRKNK